MPYNPAIMNQTTRPSENSRVIGPLAVAPLLHDFVNKEVLPGTRVTADFAANDLTIEDNEPDDLVAVVDELHNEVFAPTSVDPTDAARLQRFNEIVVSHGAYVGSRMSYRFLAKYAHLLE